MTFAEFFVGIGIKGDAATNKAIKGVKDGLGDLKSMSFEAKAAIVGAIYALERMMSTSAQQGANLMNFNALTGMSVQRLQEWQYAARQVNATNEDVAGSFKAVQSSVANMLMGKGPIEGWASVASKVGLDKGRAATDTEYVVGQLQKFAQMVQPNVGNIMLRSFGVTDGMIGAMRRNAFRPEVFARAPRYGDGELKQLDKVNAAWSNLNTQMEMAFGHFTAKHGLSIVSDLAQITKAVADLAEAITKLATQLKVFKLLGEATKGLAGQVKFASGVVTDVQSGISNGDPKKLLSAVGSAITYDPGKQLAEYLTSGWFQKHMGDGKDGAQKVDVQQTFIFNNNEGKDHKKIGHTVEKAVKDTYRQMSAVGQGS